FRSVTACTGLVVPTNWLPKFRLGGERLVPGPSPVPDSATDCGLPWALLRIVRLPLSVPGTVGEKVKLIEQAAPDATAEPQSSVSAKLASMDILRRSFWLPVLATVTVWTELLVPTCWLPKV